METIWTLGIHGEELPGDDEDAGDESPDVGIEANEVAERDGKWKVEDIRGFWGTYKSEKKKEEVYGCWGIVRLYLLALKG